MFPPTRSILSEKFGLPLTPARVGLIADYYVAHTIDINGVFEKFTHFYEQVKAIEMQFLKKNGINIVFEEEAVDSIITRWRDDSADLDTIYKQLSADLEYGLKLVREKTGRNRFFLTRLALEAPETFIRQLLKEAQLADQHPSSHIQPARRSRKETIGMIGISKLYCGTVEPSDALRYGRHSSRLPSHLLQFSEDKRPVVVWNITRACNLKCVHCYAHATGWIFRR